MLNADLSAGGSRSPALLYICINPRRTLGLKAALLGLLSLQGGETTIPSASGCMAQAREHPTQDTQSGIAVH